MDRTDALPAVDRAARVDMMRSTDRASPTKEFGEQNGGKREQKPGENSHETELPQDVVELSQHAPATADTHALPHSSRSAFPQSDVQEHHIDIQA